MATVYLALDLRHHRRVAIKVLAPELAAVLGAERFLREIEISARLNHPHILPLYDSGEASGFLFYVMPFAEGESLRDRLAREKQLPLDDALQFAREVADALSYAHSHNVVHRDIKPENVLLESGHAVVADFGIARAISEAGGDRLTETGLAIGTPSYMSPEQAAGSRELDGRSDLYSLGCVVYEMLAGEPPFTGPTVESVVHQHLAAPAQPVTAIRATVPGPVASAISRALNKAPADRFATAEQFGRALAQSAGRVTERRTTKRATVMGVVAALVVLAAGYVLAGRRGGGPEPIEAKALPRVAVLPFENLGPPEDEYFADGITDEIMTRLAGLSGLVVISPQSAMQFKGTTKSTAEIGRELDVQYLLQGRIRWQRQPEGPSRVRVTPRLIQVADDRNLWASDFDEVLEDIFRVQGAIATQVAGALGVTLLRREQEATRARPTGDSAAYEFYLRGNAYFRAGYPVLPPLREAVEMYQRALDLDPDFASAHARLSVSHGGIHFQRLDPGRDDEHLALQQEHAGRALALDSGLAEAHWAMGMYHYQGRRDYQAALGEFGIALNTEPNNSLFLGAKAALLKRTGDFAASAELNAHASDLDPLSGSPAVEAWIGYSHTRQFAKAQRYIERAASLRPDAERLSAYNRVARGEDASVLRQDLSARLGEAGLMQVVARAAHGSAFPAQGRALVRALCGICDAAIPLVPSQREQDWQRYAGIALLHERAGRQERARAYYDSAQARLESLGLRNAIWLAKLGRNPAAVTTAKENLDQAGRNRDALAEASAMQVLSEVYVTVGEHDAALERLEWLMSHPSFLSVGLLKADPLYDPLRNDPRFQALLAKYGTVARR